MNLRNERSGDTRWRAVLVRNHRRAAVFLATSLIALNQAPACSPEFPSSVLQGDGLNLLRAPQGNFQFELERIKLDPPPFQALPPSEGVSHASQSKEIELADLRQALRRAKRPTEEINRLCRAHEGQRQLLSSFMEAAAGWDPEEEYRFASWRAKRPEVLTAMVVDGLPAEFADYFRGYLAWHNPAITDKQAAREAWENLLARPADERPFKSTWAAFMLGKAWMEKDGARAIGYFQQVRELARQGFRDSLGLAAASIGMEARVELDLKHYERAIELYLSQMATGDPTATNSLITATEKALSDPAADLRALARNPRARELVTACLLSIRNDSALLSTGEAEETQREHPVLSPAARWLRGVEEAGVKDMDLAEALALTAYRANEMDAAARWIKRAPRSPAAQWIESKLLLREGKWRQAAVLLARVSVHFPAASAARRRPETRQDTLTVLDFDETMYVNRAEAQVHGELGALQLARGEYQQALDSLLAAAYWEEAAYVAERVLTVSELKNYVDRFWPALPAGKTNSNGFDFRKNLRYLLGRRLTREFRGHEAREYYPPEQTESFDRLVAALRRGWDEAAPAADRARALFEAAWITRTNGMELIATEGLPDCHNIDGNYLFGIGEGIRDPETDVVLVPPSPDELARNRAHAPDPNRRYHYRYQAAALAWEAAKLLPDNDDQTAHILWQGGSFIKYIDPKTADKFYKALVRRTRRTALGAEADRQHWFPQLDENGQIIPKPPRTPNPGLEAQPAGDVSAAEPSFTLKSLVLEMWARESDPDLGRHRHRIPPRGKR